jgi:hypothetical protein
LVEFQRLKGLFEEYMGHFEASSEIHKELEGKGSGEAQIAVAYHLLREGSRTGDIEGMKGRAHDILSHFLTTTSDPADYTGVAAVLYGVAREVDLEVLQGTCTSIPLALALGARALIDSGMLDRAKEFFEHFIYSDGPGLTAADKAKVLPVFIDFMRKGGGKITDIKRAERTADELERILRAKMLEQRRELTKDTSGPSQVLDRWMRYLQGRDLVTSASA